MKRALLLSALLLSGAGYVLLQTQTPAPKLATLMPSGALLYLEAPDFGRVLHDWDSSSVKAKWLESENYSVFSRSNLFQKLEGVYEEYGEAAGFLPDLPNIIGMAGTESALALYQIRDVEFLYISHIGESQVMQSQLWMLRDQFEQRQAGGVTFYLRTDPASKRTVAFAFTKGYLLLATRDDLVAQALALLAGGSTPSIAADRWYADSTAAAGTPGELRLVLNLEPLVKSPAFRSYWIQRNASEIRPYFAGISDVKRTASDITETRVLLRTATIAAPASDAVPGLLALVPPDAGLYKASSTKDTAAVADLIVQKLIAPAPRDSSNWRYAPAAAFPDYQAGTEADLETRIDEQPLPAIGAASAAPTALRQFLDTAGVKASLLVQSTSPIGETFVQIPSVIVLAAAKDWDRNTIRQALSAAAGELWSTGGLGAGWSAGSVGGQAVDRLDGLGSLSFVANGRFLLLSNDLKLLAPVLQRLGGAPPAGVFTYAAGFRHTRERANYDHIMSALDVTGQSGRIDGPPAFFSGNLASLSNVLGSISELQITEEEQSNKTLQTVRYLIKP